MKVYVQLLAAGSLETAPSCFVFFDDQVRERRSRATRRHPIVIVVLALLLLVLLLVLMLCVAYHLVRDICSTAERALSASAVSIVFD